MASGLMTTDEREDVLSSLKLFIEALDHSKNDASYWKWAVVSLHSAIQSAMAFHLSFGNDLLAMTQKDAEAWLNAHKNGTDYPEVKMDSFLELYKKTKKYEILGYKFRPEGQESKSMRRLNVLRNEFIHFMPKGWAIKISYMADIFNDCLNVLKKLGQALTMRWEDEKQRNLFEELLCQAKSAVSPRRKG